MDLIPYPIGPLNPKVQDLLVALPLFAAVFLFFLRVLPRIQRVLDARDDATRGATERAEAVRAYAEVKGAEAEAALAEARHDAARIRQQAAEEGAVIIAATRTEGHRERDAVLAEGHARIESERASAEAELRMQISELASDLASRIVGEQISARAEPRSGTA
ncbi:F0F1 ATP synthase subunit B family protein [Streptomyces sp. 2A115]|uniref:F0F1 ATP synthase subunit B family protein n=1 Tax=Streptomyces sp. 2A115 TaxID=3457439 RepID=UPI003FD04F58